RHLRRETHRLLKPPSTKEGLGYDVHRHLHQNTPQVVDPNSRAMRVKETRLSFIGLTER
ncbi:hypothetical protein PanWU01x14_323230, partial [Parasponia andersonii]